MRVGRHETTTQTGRLKRAVRFSHVIVIALGLGQVQCSREAIARVGKTPAAKRGHASESPSPESKSVTQVSKTSNTELESAPPNGSNDTSPASPPRPEPPRPELPRGGREIFPTYRLVGFCGTPGAPALGRLAGNLDAKAKTIASYSEKYAGGRKVMPIFELIAVVVQGAAGTDGKWRRRVPDSVVDDYLKAARAAKALLLLNIQPGHSDFLTEAKSFEKYLRQPDVGLALDPEWAMKGKQKPGVTYGQTTGAVINEVGEYLSGLVKTGDLPEKVLVFHQVNSYVVKDESVLALHPGVALVKSVDGLGPQGAKITTYNVLVKSMSPSVHAGFKLFFDEDKTNGGRLMTPPEVLALTPTPEYVMYE